MVPGSNFLSVFAECNWQPVALPLATFSYSRLRGIDALDLISVLRSSALG